MKMNKKLSLTLLVAMFSLLIIGFGGAATAQAAGNCAETLLANGASESTAFTNCRAYEADAARYNAIAAFYANEKTHAQRAFEANVARYTGLAAFYTNETSNVQRAFEADAARYTGLAAFYTNETNVQRAFEADSDSAYLAANPELMASHRFVVVDRATQTDPAAEPVDIEVLQNVILDRNYFHPGR